MPLPEGTAPRVLMVDDDPAVAHVLATLARRAGYVVVTSGNGQDAMHLLDERFEALVVDLRLPGMRGDAFYFAATARQPWLATRTIFLTADITEQAEQIIRATGCRYMQKPYDVPRLVEALTALAPLPSARVPRVG